MQFAIALQCENLTVEGKDHPTDGHPRQDPTEE